jgi:hypothetical protein
MDVNEVRLSLPADVADALVADEIAFRPIVTRGPGTGQVVQLIVDGVNTGAAVVTLAVAASSLRKLAERLWEKFRHADENIIMTIILPGAPAPRILKIKPGETDSQDRILDFIINALSTERD